ncbi:MAG: VacB/RNase II family 3'-5' exoribonuclease [Deltaproteobacteria bacterium]|nr:VacB/RNase II family 3'-5' exoribonuclease [Deltaproteobacteria bacterium]
MVNEGRLLRIRGGRYVLPGGFVYRAKEKISISPEGVQNQGKIIGKFLRTGKTGVILARNNNNPRIVVRLGDAKGVRSGTLVIAEIQGSKTNENIPKINIVEVLGKAGKLDAEYEGLSAQYNLPNFFSTEALRESEEIPPEVHPEDLRGRVDLRDCCIFTIDNDTAKDFDDAVGISRISNGYKLWVSIADVPNYVKLGSGIDNDALERGTSIYLPHRVIPMLPEALSNKLCSLVPHEDRLAKTVEMHFNDKGDIRDYKIYKSVIRSHARLNYFLASDLLDNQSSEKGVAKGIVQSLHVMKELYEKIRHQRIANGELNFDIPEPELIRDELGRTVDVIKLKRNIAHGIIEEFMIAANSSVAMHIFNSKIPSIYRIHDGPDIISLKELAQDLKKLGYGLRFNGDIKVKEIQRVILESKGKPEEIAVNMLILRSLKRALYSTASKGHFGLALKHYTHFTSPIRRYPDLVIHRIIDSLLIQRKIPYTADSLEWISKHCSTKERYADELEREAIKLESANMMKANVGKEFEGIVVSVLPFGIFVELKEVFVEGFVPREKIKGHKRRWYEIGQRVKVKIDEADVERRRITLDLVS